MNIYPKPTPAPTNPTPFLLGEEILKTANEDTPTTPPKNRDAAKARQEMEYVQSQIKEGDVIVVPVRVAHIIYSKVETAGPVAVKVVSLDATNQSTQHKPSDIMWLDTKGASFDGYQDRALTPHTDTFGFPHREILLATADLIVRHQKEFGTVPSNNDVASALGHPSFPSTTYDNIVYESWQVTHAQRTAWLRDHATQQAFFSFVHQAIAVAMGDVKFANPSSSIQDLVGNFLVSDATAPLCVRLERVIEALSPETDISSANAVISFIETAPLGISLPTIRFTRGGQRLTQEIFLAWVDKLVAAFEVSALSKVNRRQTLEAQIKASVEAGDYVRVATLAAELNSL